MNENKADLVLENADIITCEIALPRANAVAVKYGRILAVGSISEIQEFKSAKTSVIDCREKTLVPGFIDAHMHFSALVRKLLSINLNPAYINSISEIKNLVHEKTLNTPAGKWIMGTDYNEYYLKEKRHPVRTDLDEAAPNHPVILCHRTLHACVLNSLAMKLAGIDNETEEPEGGMIDRDIETGEPNGILFNMVGMIMEKLPPVSESELTSGIKQANRLLLSSGITSFTEATVSNDLLKWQDLNNLINTGTVLSRVYMMPGEEYLDQFKQDGLKTGSGGDNLKLGPVKIVLTTTNSGITPSQDELNNMILEANLNGYSAAVHAIERNCVESAITAFEYIKKQLPESKLRNRIEHCSECPPELIERMKELNMVIVSQPPFIFYSGERYLEQVDPETLKWLYPFNSLLQSGLVVSGSSDAPVVPLNPLHGIYAAATRLSENNKKVTADEAVNVQKALEMYTINAAYASGEENIKGSLSPGKMADMVLLSADPLKSDPYDFKEINVIMTVLDGKIVWEK